MLGYLEKQSIQGMHACDEKTAVEGHGNVTENRSTDKDRATQWELGNRNTKSKVCAKLESWVRLAPRAALVRYKKKHDQTKQDGRNHGCGPRPRPGPAGPAGPGAAGGRSSRGQGLFISPLSNGALRAALAFGSTRFGPSQMHLIGQAGHLALSNQERQSP